VSEAINQQIAKYDSSEFDDDKEVRILGFLKGTVSRDGYQRMHRKYIIIIRSLQKNYSSRDTIPLEN
jgi:hypothetical protein